MKCNVAVVFFGVLAIGSFCSLGQSGPAAKDIVEHLQNVLDRYHDAPMEYQSEYTKILHRDTKWRNLDLKAGDLIDHRRAKLYRQQGDWMLADFSYLPTVANAGLDRAASVRFGYDGELFRQCQFNLSSGESAPQGVIDGRAEKAKKHQFTDPTTGQFLRGTLTTIERTISLRELLSDQEHLSITLSDVSEDVGGHLCHVLNLEEPGEKATHKIWIDETVGYTFRRWEYREHLANGDQLVMDINNLEFTQHENSWFPIVGTMRAYLIDEKTGELDTSPEQLHDYTMRVELTNTKFPDSFARSDFTLAFPPGTNVWDFRTETRFVVDSQGQLQPPVNIATVLDSTELQPNTSTVDKVAEANPEPPSGSQQAADPAAAESATFTWRVLALVFGVLSVICLVLYRRKISS